MENYDDDYAEQIVQAIVPILQAREEQLIVKVKDIITEINNEQENKIQELLDTQQREREQWERERERFKEDLRRELREDIKDTIRKGTFSFKEEVETAEFTATPVKVFINTANSSPNSPCPSMESTSTEKNKRRRTCISGKSPVRYNWARDNPRGLHFIEQFCEENLHSRDKEGKDRVYKEGVNEKLWADTPEDMARVYLKVDNVCRAVRFADTKESD